jgi:hypothetical protein
MPMKPLWIVGELLASIWLLGQPTWAVQYRLQVVNLDTLTVLAQVENSRPLAHEGQHTSRLEARLDSGEFSAAAVLPGRQVQLLQEPGYGGKAPDRLWVLPNTRDSGWTTLQWEGNPGDSVAFVVKSDIRAWQEVVTVAANADGVMRRLAIGSPGWFGRSQPEVREVSYDYLANAVAHGTFTPWLEQNAKPIDGMSVVVGRGRSLIENPDRVYMVLKLPPEPHTFRVVIGWRDHRRGGGTNN